MSPEVVYEIEGDLDFFKELKNIRSNHETSSSSHASVSLNIQDTPNNNNKCLITDEPLRKDHITLICSHKFNYVPLFKEVVFQKCSLLPKNVSSSIITTYTKYPSTQMSSSITTTPSSTVVPSTISENSNASYGTQPSQSQSQSNVFTVMYNSSYNLETTKVQYNEIKCPYCRSITSHILPYYSYPEVSKIKYVNTPANLSLPALSCEYHQHNKPTKENTCKTSCMYHEKYDMMLCNKHFNKLETEMVSNVHLKTTRQTAKGIEKVVNDENIIISHHNPVTSVCSFTLLSGPRKGCPCGKPMWIPKMNTLIANNVSANAVYCKAHYIKGTNAS